MFSYPSGDLHMGHAEVFSISDAIARYLRLRGKDVLFPVGWDSFGLPAENAARKRGIDPREWTYANIEVQAESFRRMGFSFEWQTRLHTSDPEYFRWNQWIFLRMVERGLAYRASAPVNWCPQDETVLANEQVIDGRCERCQTRVVERELTQWFFRTTAYAKRLVDDMAQLEGHWPAEILTMQRHWIANLHDWLISRQRQWGTPIPIVHCGECGLVPVPDEELPLGLNLPGDTSCPRCGGPAQRDPDTMDTFVDSSWYFLRYPNPSYQDGPFDPAGIERWLPVAEYIGGREHACGHLIYARFMTKVLHDLGMLSFTEPFTRLTNQGQVIMNGKSMSKTLGNMVSLQEQIAAHGPDAVRVTMLFAGPPEEDIDWADVSPTAAVKWLGRVTRLLESLPANASGPADPQLRRAVHKLLHATTVAMDGKRFNVAIARMMELTTLLRHSDVDSATTREGADALVVMLSCFAPLTAAQLGFADSSSWPAVDAQLIAEETTTCVVQVDGKVRARLEVPVTITEADLRSRALTSVGTPSASRIIVRAPRIVNIVTG
ncbi:hypothetical protein Rhe02_46710 [Rhizocola hellebori]|uniref:leucine--tRNA ligase n=1 Tax=Rhizocola hellebori TaxID=1392758 RepID=A0A8J3QAV7_9ACTN|nr:class I tRNA ligase family protein [Rhizocola hellebori]GIH06604.1 hypothetical protein Rhe02_46710 [Rhizocola hellebori]